MRSPVSHFPEEELLERLQKGDHAAFERIYYHYSSQLYLSAYNLFRDKQICEDLVQDLFVHIWQKRKSLRIGSLKPYLYKSIRNRVLMVIRSGKAQPDPAVLKHLARTFLPDDALAEKEINLILDESVRKLPRRCREVFQLSRNERLSNKEIALRLNISVKTVEAQIGIALRRLRVSLREFLFWSGLLLIPLLF